MSVPSSPTSVRSSDNLSPPQVQLHPHQSISDMFMALNLQRNNSISGQSEIHLALGIDDQVNPGLSPPPTPHSPRRRKSSIPLTPLTPVRPRRRVPSSPVTPTRAPSKAMRLLGTAPPPLPPKQTRKKRDNFRPLPHSTLLEINAFFGNVPKKPSAKISALKGSRSAHRLPDESRNVGGGETVLHKGEEGHMWFDVEEEQEFAWLMSDPTVPRPRKKVSAPTPVEDSEDETWGMKAFTSVLAQPSKAKKEDREKSTRVEDSFVDMFDKPKVRTRRQHTKAAPHPWSAAALAQDSTPATTPPALVSRSANDSSSSSGLSSPESAASPPRRPKHRPPPLVLDLQPKSGLPVVCLNSPPAVPFSNRQPKVNKPASPAQSRRSIQTPFVHPRRAPKPRAAIGLGHPPLPRSTDTRMPLLPPLSIYMADEEELEVSCFDPVTPTDETKFAHNRSGSGEKRGWFKKVVRDLSHGKI